MHGPGIQLQSQYVRIAKAVKIVADPQAKGAGEVELHPCPETPGQHPVPLVKMAIDGKILTAHIALHSGFSGNREVGRAHGTLAIDFDHVSAQRHEQACHHGSFKKIQIRILV